MDDEQFCRFLLIYFCGVIFVIFSFTGSLVVMIFGLCLSLLLSYTLPSFMNFIATTFVSLIYGLDYSDTSYENQFYQDDMDKAKRLVRKEKWDKAIAAYREIIGKTPKKCEPRFNLAKVYQMVGQLGLAMSEYHKIKDLKDELGPNHVFVLESERAIEELKERLSIKMAKV